MCLVGTYTEDKSVGNYAGAESRWGGDRTEWRCSRLALPCILCFAIARPVLSFRGGESGGGRGCCLKGVCKGIYSALLAEGTRSLHWRTRASCRQPSRWGGGGACFVWKEREEQSSSVFACLERRGESKGAQGKKEAGQGSREEGRAGEVAAAVHSRSFFSWSRI